MARLNIGILGTGNIAGAMAETVNKLGGEIKPYAVASRTPGKARTFAGKWHFEKAYGSYEELAADSAVDLVYIATPHSEHYANAKLCMEHGKPVLVEKAFTGNAKQAEELLAMSKEKNLLAAEAIWPRYMPSRRIIKGLLDDGSIGEARELEAEFSAVINDVRRMYDPALCGGALLDLGVYAMTTASIYFGDDISSMESTCQKYRTGVDAIDEIAINYRNGRKARLRCSMLDGPQNRAKIIGTKGYIEWRSLNNPYDIKVYDSEGRLQREAELPPQITGYEYEVLACKDALEKGFIECADMPHSEILTIMEQMDTLRGQWGVKYPFE